MTAPAEGVARRLAFLATFAVIMWPAFAAALLIVLAAALCWLAGGNSARTERILLNPVLGFLVELPWRAKGTAA